MNMPRLNSFSIIGVILVAVAIYALVRGSGFEFDPGVPSEKGEPIFYLIVGALMLINGFVLPPPATDDENSEHSSSGDRTVLPDGSTMSDSAKLRGTRKSAASTEATVERRS